VEYSNIFGAVTALIIFALVILVFVYRLLGKERTEYWLGFVLLLTGLPLVYLLITGSRYDRPLLYYVQVGLMLCYLVVELILDYILKAEFRKIRWAALAYVMLFFAGTGGMVGVAALAGRSWIISAAALFLTMTVLSFVQHAKTGQ